MSLRINQDLESWKAVETKLRRTPFVYRALPFENDVDNYVWADALLFSGAQLVDLLSDFFSPDIARRRAKQWIFSIVHDDVYDVSASLKELNGFLKGYFHVACTEGPTSLTCFKHRDWERRTLVLKHYAPVSELVERFLESCSPEDFRPLNQFTSFLSHVQIRSSIMTAEAVEKFEEVDLSLSLRLSPDSLRELNSVMKRWLRLFTLEEDNFFPQHGPGAVAPIGRCSSYEKYDLLASDPLIDEWFRWKNIDPNLVFPNRKEGLDRTAKLIPVPKTTLVSRTICEEPATLQYLQQGVLKALAAYIQSSPLLHEHVKLEDQGVNAERAREGSLFGQLATIDLSMASDSVSWELVRQLFKGTPLLPWLLVTRSRQVEVEEGRILQPKKFAPMGSALCFPIECLVFSAACEVVCKRNLHESKYWVYGDDIVIPSVLADDLISLLQDMGFEVNTSKSYYHEDLICFRESCGGEYVNGVDVSPLRLSRKFDTWSDNPKDNIFHSERYSSLIQLANACYDRGFTVCRRLILKRLLSLPRSVRPVFGVLDHQVHSPDVTNFHVRKQWNRLGYQTLDAYYGVVKSVPRRTKGVPLLSDSHQEYSYFYWCQCARERSSYKTDYSVLDPIDTSLELRAPKLKGAWGSDVF